MDTTQLDHLVVTRPFRETVVRHYPRAADEPGLMRLILLLLLRPWLDDTEAAITPYQQLAECAGQSQQGLQHNFEAEVYLTQLQDEGLPLIVTLPRWASRSAHSRARTLTVDWATEIEVALWTELATPWEIRQRQGVYGMSGQPYSQRRYRAAVQQWRQETAASLLPAVHPAGELIDYLNRQSPLVFQRMVQRNMEAARQKAANLVRDGPDGIPDALRTQRVRRSALQLLNRVEQDPMPLYKPSEKGKTARIFPHGPTYLNLPREVRRVLTAGSAECDLANCQLAIAAKEWDVPQVQTFLETGQKIWAELANFFGVDVVEFKPLLKAFLYGLLFGMRTEYGKRGERRGLVPLLATGLEANTDGKAPIRHGPGVGWDQAQRWKEHPLLKALYEARERRLKELRQAGRAETCFGSGYEIKTSKDARSALAAQMQAIELSLLLPAFEFVRGQRDLTIVAWQHDGFTLHSSDASKLTSKPGRRGYMERLQEVVDTHIQQRGYATRLEAEVLLPLGSFEASQDSASHSAPSQGSGVGRRRKEQAPPQGADRTIESYPEEDVRESNAVLNSVYQVDCVA